MKKKRKKKKKVVLPPPQRKVPAFWFGEGLLGSGEVGITAIKHPRLALPTPGLSLSLSLMVELLLLGLEVRCGGKARRRPFS